MEWVHVEMLPGQTPHYNEDGQVVERIATCGTCGRSWNDAAVSSVTPVPAGRCPFEYDHEEQGEQVELREGTYVGASLDAMGAAVSFVRREWGESGYMVERVASGPTRGSVRLGICAGDGSRFTVEADRWGNAREVLTVRDPYLKRDVEVFRVD